MNVLLMMSDINYSGAPKILVWLANKLINESNNVSILTIYAPPRGQKIDEKVKCTCLNINQSKNWMIRNTVQMLFIAKKFISYFRDNKFDVVISFADTPGILLLVLKKVLKVKVIVSERGDPYTKESSMDDLRKRFYGLADGIVFQTEDAKNYFNEKIKQKSIVIPNPVVNNKIPPKYKGVREETIVSVGRLDIFQKRQDVLIKAFALISKKYSNIGLVLYGDGPDREKLVQLTQEMGLSGRITFAGITNTVYESIRKAKLFVLSSDYEGIPNALIEAMSIGLPVVSTDCSPGGAKMLIKNYKNGILVPRGDISELAKSMAYILDNPEEAETMGDNALNILDKYEENRIFTIWSDFLKEKAKLLK